jgi:hypothetical protein
VTGTPGTVSVSAVNFSFAYAFMELLLCDFFARSRSAFSRRAMQVIKRREVPKIRFTKKIPKPPPRNLTLWLSRESGKN